MDDKTAFESRCDLASYDAVDLGERIGDYINHLRGVIIMQQERIDMLQRWVADLQKPKPPF
jgi:hypothetical protein